MKFDSFKENVKQLLKADSYNKLSIFIENYNVTTQIHYNTNTNLKVIDRLLAKEIVSLLDDDTREMLFQIRDFKCYYDLGDLYSLWKIIYIKLFEPIIIIGAGISGLTIASGLYDINDNDSFLILEARDRIGGRVYTNEHNIDMGAAWIHGSVNNPLNKFIDYNNMIPVANCNPWILMRGIIKDIMNLRR